MTQNELNRPFSILSVDLQGNFSTFDPELLSVASDRYGSFNLGNLKDLPLVESTHTDQFRRLMADMSSGVDTCHKGCEYFGLCSGGNGSNLEVVNDQLQPPLGTGAMFWPFKQVSGKSISQMNFKVGANNDLQATGFSYRISVQGCN